MPVCVGLTPFRDCKSLTFAELNTMDFTSIATTVSVKARLASIETQVPATLSCYFSSSHNSSQIGCNSIGMTIFSCEIRQVVGRRRSQPVFPKEHLVYLFHIRLVFCSTFYPYSMRKTEMLHELRRKNVLLIVFCCKMTIFGAKYRREK